MSCCVEGDTAKSWECEVSVLRCSKLADLQSLPAPKEDSAYIYSHFNKMSRKCIYAAPVLRYIELLSSLQEHIEDMVVLGFTVD